MKGLSVFDMIAPSCIVYSCKIFKYISNLELMYPANSIITEQCLEIIMVCFSHFVKTINRQKHCKEFRDRYSQPDSIYADEFRKRRIFTTIIPNVRTKEMIAEIFPLENAVNMEEAKILIPAKI